MVTLPEVRNISLQLSHSTFKQGSIIGNKIGLLSVVIDQRSLYIPLLCLGNYIFNGNVIPARTMFR